MSLTFALFRNLLRHAAGEAAGTGGYDMIMKGRALSGVLMLSCASLASAQTVAPASPAVVAPAQPQAVILTTPTQNVLRAGTPVALKMSEGLTTEKKKLRVGYRFQMETAEPVTLNGQVVIPVGSPVTGEVTQIRNKGIWGKSGYIGAQVLFVRANGRQIRMTGQFDDKGVTGTAGVVGAIAFVPVAGFLMTGTSARIPMGSGVKGFIDEDVSVAFADAPTPMTVVPAAAPMPSPAPSPAVATPVIPSR